MAPEPEVCGKTIGDFPGIPIEELSPDQIQQINDVCIFRKLSTKRLKLINSEIAYDVQCFHIVGPEML